MDTTLSRVIISAPLLIALLGGCAHQAETALPPPGPPSLQAPQAAQAAAPLPAPESLVSFANVDEYKYLAAQYVMRHNAAQTFSGRLPPMLPAIVVLRITIDRSGTITDVFIQRPPARDDGESEIAMASMRRTAVLPRPLNLASGPGQTLSYSETFLFNADMRFQLRTLAPIQGTD